MAIEDNIQQQESKLATPTPMPILGTQNEKDKIEICPDTHSIQNIILAKEKTKELETLTINYNIPQEKQNPFSRFFIVLSRILSYNLDAIVLIIIIIICVTIGYTIARLNGVTTTEIQQEAGSWLELVLLVLSGLGASVLKLGMQHGIIGSAISNKLTTFKNSVSGKQQKELDTWGRTIVDDHEKEK